MPSVIIRKKAFLEFGIGLCLLIGIGVCSYISLNELNTAMEWVKHTYVVKCNLDELELQIRTAESNQRGYLLTGKEFYLADFYIAIEKVYTTQAMLLSQLSDNKAQVARLRNLYVTTEKRLQILKQVAELKQVNRVEEANTIVDSSKGRQTMIKLLEQSKEIKNVEDFLLNKRLQKQNQVHQTATSVIIFGGVISIVITFGSMTIINNFNHRSSQDT